jgi:hypothetical protein
LCLRRGQEVSGAGGRLLWWRGTGWATPGDFGPLIMPLDEALNFVATEDFFWIGA